MRTGHVASLAALTIVLAAGFAFAGDAASPTGDPVLEPPTLHSLGVYWIIQGDDNQNAAVKVAYRKAGTDAWSDGPPLFRVGKGPYGEGFTAGPPALRAT